MYLCVVSHEASLNVQPELRTCSKVQKWTGIWKHSIVFVEFSYLQQIHL